MPPKKRSVKAAPSRPASDEAFRQELAEIASDTAAMLAFIFPDPAIRPTGQEDAILRLAGYLGIDPLPFTYGQLLTMAGEKQARERMARIDADTRLANEMDFRTRLLEIETMPTLKPSKTKKPGLRPTDEERKQNVLAIVRNLGTMKGRHASVKAIIRELAKQGIPQRPQTTREILRELKTEGKYKGLN